MKYKKGDKVRIRRDLVIDEKYGRQVFVDEMAKFKGKEVTIGEVWIDAYYIKEDESFFNWTDDMFEPIIDDTTKSIIENYEEDELSFNFTISKYQKNSLEARRNALIMLFSEIMQKDTEINTKGVSDIDIWSINDLNDLIDTMEKELELFKRRTYNG